MIDFSEVLKPGLEHGWGQYYAVLDHGFVQVVDVMGTDHEIAAAARVSYANDQINLPDEEMLKKNERLIRYLMRNGHTSPFEMAEIKFHLKLPIFVMRQLVRHRTANLNEVSARYTEMEDEFYVPALEQIRGQHSSNKQAGGEPLDPQKAAEARGLVEMASSYAYDLYLYLLDKGVARELARIVLPVNLYTRCYWKMDLHNLLHFLKLRLDWHAQWEIRQYALAMAHVVSLKFPQTWAAFCEYRLNDATPRVAVHREGEAA